MIKQRGGGALLPELCRANNVYDVHVGNLMQSRARSFITYSLERMLKCEQTASDFVMVGAVSALLNHNQAADPQAGIMVDTTLSRTVAITMWS